LGKNNKDFLERLLDMTRQSLLPEKGVGKGSPCGEHTPEDFDRYVKESMPASDVGRFEEHCLECVNCAAQILLARDKLIHEKEKAENEALLKRTMSFVDRLLKEKDSAREQPWLANRINIVVEFAQGFWQLVNTTGEVLTPRLAVADGGFIEMKSSGPDSGVKRFNKPKEEMTEPEERLSVIQIAQEFSSPGISLQASISSEESGRLMLTLSFAEKDTQKEMQGVDLQLMKEGTVVKKAVSGKNGRASFVVRVPAVYEIDILKEGAKIGNISFKAQD
jgi:hypothetical protein